MFEEPAKRQSIQWTSVKELQLRFLFQSRHLPLALQFQYILYERGICLRLFHSVRLTDANDIGSRVLNYKAPQLPKMTDERRFACAGSACQYESAHKRNPLLFLQVFVIRDRTFFRVDLQSGGVQIGDGSLNDIEFA